MKIPSLFVSIAAIFGAFAVNAQAQTLSDSALVEKGHAIATAADCMACHTAPRTGKSFAGGYPIVSPLGTIYSTNITPSKTSGVGDYSEAEFSRAVRQGIRKDGAHLYPAMPYDSYAGITDEDMHALYAYFMHGVEPVDDAPKAHTALPFPFNLRFSMAFWNLLYARTKPFAPAAGVSDDINRGAYLVNVLGHCASCHTPRNMLMGAVQGEALAGGFVGPWYAPNITADPVSGIGGWTQDELVAYLRTGHAKGKNQAAGGMAEAVQNSLQYLPASDLVAIAAYLRSTAPIRDTSEDHAAYEFGSPHSDEDGIRGAYPPTSHDSLKSGRELYSGYCASCHQPNGAGSDDQAYPSLFHNTATGSIRPANLVAAILYGVDREVGGKEVLMPGFGKQSYVTPLTDRQIADLSNYVLQNFGNPQAKVTPDDVATARAGGPKPLLAIVQPYILPASAGTAVVIILIAAGWLIGRRRRQVVAA